MAALIRVLIAVLITFIVGYRWGKKTGYETGLREGLAYSPLELRQISLAKGTCMICGHESYTDADPRTTPDATPMPDEQSLLPELESHRTENTTEIEEVNQDASDSQDARTG